MWAQLSRASRTWKAASGVRTIAYFRRAGVSPAVTHRCPTLELLDHDESRLCNPSRPAACAVRRLTTTAHGHHSQRRSAKKRMKSALSQPSSAQMQTKTKKKEEEQQAGTSEAEAPPQRSWIGKYFAKWRGAGQGQPPRPPLISSLITGVFSFGGITALSLAHFGVIHEALSAADSMLLIGSFGATAALVYGAPVSPFSQPRNVIGGHVLSGTVGVTTHLLMIQSLGLPNWIACPTAVAVAIMGMAQTRTLHPPAAATALIAVMGSPVVIGLGYWYVLVPCAAGSTVLVATGVLFNNLLPNVRYPMYWF